MGRPSNEEPPERDEGTLRESEARFRELADSAPVLLWRSGTDALCDFFNRSWLEFRGRTMDEEVGNGWFEDGVHTEDKQHCWDIYAGAFEAREEFEMEYRLRRYDGEYRWILDRGAPRQAPGGEFVGYIGSCIDVTERKRNEEEFERRARLLELTQDAVVVRRTDGTISFWNRGAEQMYGWEREQAVDKVSHELLKTRFPEPLERLEEELLRNGHWEGELEHLTREGRPIFVTSRWAAEVEEDGAIGLVLETNTDVTERRHAEEERERLLRESERRAAELATIIDSIPDALYVGNENGITMCNEAALQMLGFETVEELNQQIHLLAERIQTRYADTENRVPPEEEPFSRALGGETCVREIIARHLKTGRDVVLRSAAAPIRHEGRIVGAVAVNTDITEQKRTEEALREVRDAERNRMARDLHDGAVQDLSYGLMEAEVARVGLEDPESAAALGRATDALRRAAWGLRAAVNDLRLGEEQNRPPSQLVEALVQRSRAMDPERDIRLEVQEGFPSEPLGNAGVELLRITQEALTNARRHSGASSVRVGLRTEEDDLIVEVSDDGHGFGTQTEAGVGLGSMRERARRLGGALEVESAPGEGTRVRLRVSMRNALADAPQNRAGGDRRRNG